VSKLSDVTRKGGPRCAIKSCGRVATESLDGRRYCKVHAKGIETLAAAVKDSKGDPK
jgi:hypothetical protein